MTITFVGNFDVDYSSESHHAKTLESMGHRVIRLQEGRATTNNILSYGLRSDLVVFVHTHGRITRGSIRQEMMFKQLKINHVPVITYHLDLWLGIQRQNDLHTDPFYKSIDYFFTVDKLMADWFNDNTSVKGVYLPAGVFDKEVYYSPADKVNDVIFVGSKGYHPEHPYRPKLIDNLSSHYGDRFKHYGGGSVHGSARGDDLNKLYARTKVVVGDTLCKDFTYPYYLSDRIFETTGRGGFIIHPYIKGMEDLFEIGKEIVTYTFDDFDELYSKIDYYLEHDDKREEIRIAGHERTKRDHTYMNRWTSILKELGK